MRIYKNKYYIEAVVPGISGFQEWDKREYYLVSGVYAQKNKTSIVKEYFPKNKGQFALCNGHLPEYRPIVDETKALEYVKNCYKKAFIL